VKVRARVVAALVAVALSAGVLAACGSDDNGGVINQPTATTAPGAVSTTTGGGAPNY
jgi:hypothetical protein